MSVLIIEEKPPHFTDVEFEYKGLEFKAQICLLDTGKVMISFRVPKNELEQNLCKGLLNSRGTKFDIKINHLPMCANVCLLYTSDLDKYSYFAYKTSANHTFLICSYPLHDTLHFSAS